MKTPCRIDLLPFTPPPPPHSCTLIEPGPSISCKAGDDGGREQTFHLVAIDALGTLVANFTSTEPFFALTDLDENVTLMISASNSEGNSSVLTLTTGHGGDGLLPEEHSLPENLASPSLGPGLLAIIGVCILLVLLVVVIITLCRAKSPAKEEESK